jgi:hypothetical protein
LAYERWRNWSFGLGTHDNRLHQISHSELDYAIVGYACECMDAAERQAVKDEIASALTSMANLWHRSHADFISEVSRQLSRLQPYSYSEKVTTSDDWLMERQYFLPFDPKSDRYSAMIYKTGQPLG